VSRPWTSRRTARGERPRRHKHTRERDEFASSLIEETGHRRCRQLRVRRAGYETSAYWPCELAPPHFAAPGK
jgi:hypothetical protein